MKKIIILTMIIMISISLSACSDDEKQSVKTSQVQKLDLKLEINEDTNNGKPKFTITTNLPDNTEGVLSLTNEKTDYVAQDTAIIKNGTAVVGEFSDNDNPLVEGDYTVRFSTSTSSSQPKSVQSIIGKDYENIKSKYILSEGENTNIEYEKEINLKQ